MTSQTNTTRSRRRAAMAVSSVLLTLSACAAAPSQRVLKTEPVAQGAGTVESARAALTGRWLLVSLQVSTEDGRSAAIDAAGALDAERHGQLDVQYRVSDAGQRALAGLGITLPDPVISTAGRVVIDAQRQTVTYVSEAVQARATGFDADLNARRANPFALERVRYFTLDGQGGLVLSTRYDNGKDAAVSRWKQAQ
jgi:hypothetical protein